jgi:hypothetical protein
VPAAALLRELPASLPANWMACRALPLLHPLAAVLLQLPAQRPAPASASAGLQLGTAPAGDRTHPQLHGCPGRLPAARAPRASPPPAAACPPAARCVAPLQLPPSRPWDLQSHASRLLFVR